MFALLHACALRNYLGGAFCYVNREYSGRVKIIVRSWRTANNVKEEEDKDPDAEEEEEAWHSLGMAKLQENKNRFAWGWGILT